LDKAHITAISPEDQGHVETEIPEALPLSHSLEFFLFKERGGRARFAHPVVRSKRRRLTSAKTILNKMLNPHPENKKRESKERRGVVPSPKQCVLQFCLSGIR